MIKISYETLLRLLSLFCVDECYSNRGEAGKVRESENFIIPETIIRLGINDDFETY